MWKRDEDRLALIELLESGSLRRRAGQSESWSLLDALPWTRRTSRRDEIALVPEHREAIVALLDRIWPLWRRAMERLAKRNLSPTPTDWRRLQDMARAENAAALPGRINRRTAASLFGPHSKSGLSAIRRDALEETVVTHDGIVRLRPTPGLRLARGDNSVDAAEIAGILGEIAVTERALLDGVRIDGPFRAALLVENLGPYQDLKPPDGWLVAHVPGWNTATARFFLGLLGDVPVLHFGDLDPAGFRIFSHLRCIHPRLKWAVFDFFSEYIDQRALPGEWPEELDLRGAPALIRDLARRGLWLEQESLCLDPRLEGALVSSIIE